MIYVYMNLKYSGREIEKACRCDINFMWRLEGAKPPDHSTIAKFRSLHFAPVQRGSGRKCHIFFAKWGSGLGRAFIEGSKIEACVNKYAFCGKHQKIVL